MVLQEAQLSQRDRVKLQICRKPTHTDQYLNVNSHDTTQLNTN